MALQKQNLPIALNAPMDTKVDEKLTNQEIFLLHENSRFEKIGALTKRNGYYDNSPSASFNIERVLNTDKGILALAAPGFTPNAHYRDFDTEYISLTESSYDSSMATEFTGEIVASNAMGVMLVDNDKKGDRLAYISAPKTTSQLGLISLIDKNTGSKKIAYTQTSGYVFLCRFFEKANGTVYLQVIYQDTVFTTTLRIETYDMNLTLVNNTSLTTIVASTLCLMMDEYNEGVAIVYQSTGLDRLRIVEANETGVTSNTERTLSFQILNTCTLDFRIVGDIIYILYPRNSAGVVTGRLFSYNLSTNVLVNSERAVIAAAADYGQLTFDFLDTDTIGCIGSVTINAAASNPLVYFTSHVISTSTTTTTTERYSIHATSRAKKLNSTTLIAACASYGLDVYAWSNDSFFQNSYIAAFSILNNPCAIIGTFNTGTTPRYLSYNRILNSNLVKEDLVYYGSTARVVAITGDGEANEVNAAYGFTINAEVDNYQKNSVSKLGDNFFISSGMLLEYDGKNLMESSFITPCAIRSVASNAGAGIAAGTYSFVAVYEYLDANGQRSQSAPSDPSSITIGGAVASFTVNVATYIGRKGQFVAVVLYMTTNGGSTYYRQSQLYSGNTVLTTFTVSSVVDGSTEVLYTTGGVVANDPPPPTKYICSHQERLYAIDADYPNQISYTKKSGINKSAEWSVFFKIYLSASDIKRANELIGLASLNEKLIILRKSSLYYLSGDGPNDLGEQNNFTEPELISSDLGCIESQSIIATPRGILFKSAKGIYLLDPSLNPNYIGSPVEEYNSEEVIASALVENKNIVYFQTTSRIMIYDYLIDRWSVDTIAAIGLTIFNNKPVILKSANTISFESTAYADQFGVTTTGIAMLVETGWIKTTGIQDFGRIVNALILGKYKSAHTLRVDVYYDYVETVASSYDLTHNVAQSVYQFRIQLKQQKCESIKFKIYDVPESEGESCELTNLTLELGVKQGTYKTQASRNY